MSRGHACLGRGGRSCRCSTLRPFSVLILQTAHLLQGKLGKHPLCVVGGLFCGILYTLKVHHNTVTVAEFHVYCRVNAVDPTPEETTEHVVF